MPVDVAPLISRAAKAHAAGRLGEAASVCREALAADQGNVQANMLLGVVEVKSGNLEEGIRRLERVRWIEPGSFQAPLWLSMAQRQAGRLGIALQAALDAVAINTDEAQGQAQLGLCYLDARMLPEAEAALQRAAELAPAVAEIRLNLARCLYLQGRRPEASAVLSQVLDRKGRSVEAILAIGKSLMASNFTAGAMACGHRAVALAPETTAAHILLARALLEEHRAVEAEEQLQIAAQFSPNDADVVAMRGDALRILGRIEEASEMFQSAINVKREQGYAYFVLAHNGRMTEADRPRLETMRDLAETPDLPLKQKGYLQYGLGKGYEDLREYEAAMAAYDAANGIERERKFRGRAFDRDVLAASAANTRRVFSRGWLEARTGFGSASQLPILVVGMMRSGTTLVEQILSSHPEVGGAGEQMFWMDNRRSAFDPSVEDVNAARLAALAERYLAVLREAAPEKPHVVDKMPNNISNLGMIYLAFPQARIVHVRRDPVDTCLSIWTTPNSAMIDFLHDREDIVFAYREYLKMAEHWRSVLPPEIFIEVDYEELVTDRERVTRKMIQRLGLPWSDRCLEPEKNDRAVITPSVWQVRQPVYRTSVRRWKKFEPWLGPFRELI